jgi:hypothetical protein
VYRIIELNPGTYTLTFSLSGFGTVSRGGIQLAGTQVITIPIEMRVGGLEETVTVTGETPVVDVQSVRRETVLDAEVIQTVPGTRTVGNLLNATPGLTVDGNGVNPTPTMTFFSARGGQANEGRMTVNGLTVAAAFNGGGVSSYILDSVNADETTVTVSGGMGESDTGGPVMNIVPRAGGNSFRGQAFINNAGDWSRGDNLDDELRAAGITETPGILRAYDSSLTYSGPVSKRLVAHAPSRRKEFVKCVAILLPDRPSCQYWCCPDRNDQRPAVPPSAHRARRGVARTPAARPTFEPPVLTDGKPSMIQSRGPRSGRPESLACALVEGLNV